MNNIGSPRWFNEKAKEKLQLNIDIEELRYKFIERFSPEKLKAMGGKELLVEVFGNNNDSMLYLLTFDDAGDKPTYRWFGATGAYKYTWIVYKTTAEHWKYYKKGKAKNITESEAEILAMEIRDMLLQCIDEIEKIGVFKIINDYKKLDKNLSKVFFYKYTWTMKYYQMIYPQYFPGMYAEKTINRALEILGLPKSGSKNIVNAGVISLFIRNCDINNIVFNQVYSDQWTWSESYSPCENAPENIKNSSKPVETVNLGYYRLKLGDEIKQDFGINSPLKPKQVFTKDGIKKVICPRCYYEFNYAKRCPDCGQSIDYKK